MFSLLVLICGFFVSAFGTLIGFGGGVFMIPILVIVFQVKITWAVGAVVVSLLPAALIASMFNFRERLIDPVVALWLEIPTVLGAILGAYLTSILPVRWLEIAFAVFLCFIAWKMYMTTRSGVSENSKGFVARLNRLGPQLQRSRGNETYRIGVGAAAVFGGTAGILAGLFGVGGGFLKTPIMIRIFGMPARLAVGTALFMIVFTSTVAMLSHLSLGHVHWSLTLPLVTGFVLGAFAGNLLKKRFSNKHTEHLIAAGLFLAGLSTFIHAIMI